ncbi:terminase small subunit [Arthrobacter phage Cole]|uniref:Terminase small subunit n=1 Tax=Arthrobacter phage Cole TaxID=2944951 RepID=A0A9E7E5P8_9CAUD|nr:terminase small subunit [Arthrobacter phage Cole]URC18041.1 terminase small subunit [Arthrobacter phage Cole]
MTKREQPQSAPIEPPASLPPAAVEVWNDIVSSNDLAGNVDRSALEAFCTLMARLREARSRVEEEGMVVKDPRGRVVPHPALAVERQAAEQIRAWGDRFAPLVKPARKRGYMADATAQSIAAAPHLSQAKFAGPVAAVKTLAWMIDEAQRDSMEALQKAMTTTVPNYLKACADLQITPASVPGVVAPVGDAPKSSSKVSDMREAAERRRAAAG